MATVKHTTKGGADMARLRRTTEAVARVAQAAPKDAKSQEKAMREAMEQASGKRKPKKKRDAREHFPNSRHNP